MTGAPAVEAPRCDRCGSARWVSVSFDEGWSRRAQCVLCGALHQGGICIGPGWRSPRFNDPQAVHPAYRRGSPAAEGVAMKSHTIPLDDPRVLALARARQQLAHDYTQIGLPSWEELSDDERTRALPEARNYLQSAIDAGLIPAGADAGAGREPK